MIPVGLPSVAIGMYMHAFDPNVSPILVLPSYLINHSSTLIGGLAMGGILLSLIGSIGGLSLGIGTMISHDIIMPITKITDDLKLLKVTKLTVLAVMILACLISIANRGSEVLFWNYLLHGPSRRRHFHPLHPGCFPSRAPDKDLGRDFHGRKYPGRSSVCLYGSSGGASLCGSHSQCDFYSSGNPDKEDTGHKGLRAVESWVAGSCIPEG